MLLREVAVVGGFGGSSVGSPDAGPEQLTAYEVEGAVRRGAGSVAG